MDNAGDAEHNLSVIGVVVDPSASYGWSAQPASFRYTNSSAWIGGKPSIAEPACGFDGMKCALPHDPVLLLAATAALLLAAALSVRHCRYEQILDSILWRIEAKDLTFIKTCNKMSEAVAKGEDVLLKEAVAKFVSTYAVRPAAAAAAPGRVNLIGEHVDYCEGYVLPVALPFLTVVVGAYNNRDECRVLSVLANGQEVETTFLSPAASPPQPGEPKWANYVKGVLANFPKKVQGFDAVIISDVPMGSGVSSSASLEVAFFTFLEDLTKTTVDPVKKAQLCQKAEHEFPGMPCGIMDQFIVTLGKKDHALLIDCRSLESTHVPLKCGDRVILVVNSNVKHELTGSEYPQRRQQCQQAADSLGLPSLRGATVKDLADLKCDELVLKRARHVVEEIARTEKVAQLLSAQDLEGVGKLFYGSHESLSELMEVSCPELDQLVDILRSSSGVLGARMTGGGFGGCVIALINKEYLDVVKRKILAEYKGSPSFFVCEPSDGARVLKL